MKQGKVQKTPLTDIQRLARKVEAYRLPSSPFDYATRTQAVNDAQQFFYGIVREGRRYYADPEASAVIEAARRLCHTALDQAYPPGFWEDYERLRAGDPAGLESAVSFLEADPLFYRTGYLKTKLIQYIKPPMLTTAYKKRLQQVVLAVVDTRDDRDFRSFCKLACKVDTPALREQLTLRLMHEKPATLQAIQQDLNVRRRARWVLEALARKDSMERTKMA